MKQIYFSLFLLCTAVISAQTCPGTAFANGSNIYFNDSGNTIDCGALSPTITVEGITYTRIDCDSNSMIYSTLDTPINDNIPFAVDFGVGLICNYDASGTLPVDEFILKNSLDIYPNPLQNTNLLKISIGYPISGKIELYSVTGKLELNTDINKSTSKEVNLAGINNGIYLLKISTETAFVTRKVVIMK